jgi:hypothetical protein
MRAGAKTGDFTGKETVKDEGAMGSDATTVLRWRRDITQRLDRA